MATEQAQTTKSENVELQYSNINGNISTSFGDNSNNIPSSSITNTGTTNKGMTMHMTTTTTSTTNTTNPETPSLTTSTIATYTNEAANIAKEEEVKQEEVEEEEEEEEKDNNIISNMSEYNGLPSEATFHDINDEDDDETQMIGNGRKSSNHKNNRSNDKDSYFYNGSKFDIWCFCFFIPSQKLPTFIEEPLYNLKIKNDSKFKNQRHLGVCKYIIIIISIWIIISIYFGICLFMIISSSSCIISQHNHNNININNINQKHHHSICYLSSYSQLFCNKSHSLLTYNLWHTNIINSSYCPEINKNTNNILLNISMDEYKINNTNQCPYLLNNNLFLKINQTKDCWIDSCNPNQVLFTQPNIINDEFELHIFCGLPILIIGVLLFCFGQCCIINVKQLCFSKYST